MITTFGFAHGTPPLARQTFDVRDLTHNPHAPAFHDRLVEILQYVQAHRGAPVAIGCEHGQHRSVTLAREVGRRTNVPVRHRDYRKAAR